MTTPADGHTEWGGDFFGTLNEMPAEPVQVLSESLELGRTLPGFQTARRALLRDLRFGAGDGCSRRWLWASRCLARRSRVNRTRWESSWRRPNSLVHQEGAGTRRGA